MSIKTQVTYNPEIYELYFENFCKIHDSLKDGNLIQALILGYGYSIQ